MSKLRAEVMRAVPIGLGTLALFVILMAAVAAIGSAIPVGSYWQDLFPLVAFICVLSVLGITMRVVSKLEEARRESKDLAQMAILLYFNRDASPEELDEILRRVFGGKGSARRAIKYALDVNKRILPNGAMNLSRTHWWQFWRADNRWLTYDPTQDQGLEETGAER